MKKFTFLFCLLTVSTVLSIPISTSTYPREVVAPLSLAYSFNGETDTLFYLPDTTKFIDKYAIAEEIYSIHTRFSPKDGWEYYKVKEIQFLFSSMVLGDTLKQLSFYKDTLTNLVYNQPVNIVFDSSLVYPNWCSIQVSNEFPVISGVVEIPLPMNSFSLCLPTNAATSGNTIGFYDKFQGWGVTGDLPIKLVIEKNDSNPPAKTIQVTFSVNMELERLAGLFNPMTDTLSVRGSFNSWRQTIMAPTSDNTDIYKVVEPVISEVGEKISFKFFYTPGTWEVDNLTDNTQNDRYFIVSQTIFDSGSTSYYATGFNVGPPEPPHFFQDPTIVFKCNTNGASIINAPLGTEFKTIYIAGANAPMLWPSSGWPEFDLPKVIQLFDDGTHDDTVAGDKIFTRSLKFPSYYTPLDITYKYNANWGLSTNGGGNDNELVTGSNHTLQLVNSKVYYVVNDTFGIAKNHDFTEVEKIRITIPSAYTLEQNYPNPFNPETVISWQLAASGFVTLKVYDVLGNEVATLVNEFMQAGIYNQTFNVETGHAPSLPSGVYFYQLRAGNFVETKKMILLR